jgi:hypothetical protein
MCASPWLHHPAPALLRSKQRRAHCCLRLQRSPGKEDEAAGKELGKNHLEKKEEPRQKKLEKKPPKPVVAFVCARRQTFPRPVHKSSESSIVFYQRNRNKLSTLRPTLRDTAVVHNLRTFP